VHALRPRLGGGLVGDLLKRLLLHPAFDISILTINILTSSLTAGIGMSDRSELALELTDAVAAAHQAIERAGDRAFRTFGLSHRAHAALSAVDQGGPDGARPSDIARELGVSRAAATTFIQRLEAKGLVETTTDPDDDRGVRVTLSRHGLEVLLRVGQLERRLGARTIEGMPASAIARAVHLLQEFRQRLEQKQLEVVR
jgi:DNA-binding MarR family transcriptional regulator